MTKCLSSLTNNSADQNDLNHTRPESTISTSVTLSIPHNSLLTAEFK